MKRLRKLLSLCAAAFAAAALFCACAPRSVSAQPAAPLPTLERTPEPTPVPEEAEILPLQTQPPGGAYYVSPDGDDAGAGTYDDPWRTLGRGVGALLPGDTLLLFGGVYGERVSINRSGRENAWITIACVPGETPVLDGTNLPLLDDDAQNALLCIQNQSYVRVIGLTLQNNVSYTEDVPSGIYVCGAGEHIEIRSCTVRGIQTFYTADNPDGERNAHGIAVCGSNGETPLDGIVIDGCEVCNNRLGWSESVVLNGNVTNFAVTNNRVHDNDNIGIDFAGFEGAAPRNDRARNGLCAGNLVWNISSADNPAYGGAAAADGIYVDGGQSIVIERNRVWNCDIGIEAASERAGGSAEDIVVRSNIVSGCRAVAGIAIGGYDALRGRASGIKIVNNTLVGNAPNILLQFYCQNASNEILNNILWAGEGIIGSTDNIRIEGNFINDPLFADEANGEYRLSADSAAVDAGVPSVWAGDTDFSGGARVRGAGIDCGALEAE